MRSPHVRVVLASLVVALTSLAGCQTAGDIRSNAAKMQLGMTSQEVTSVMGEPTVREAFSKEGKQVEYWSYYVEHPLFRNYNVYECVTFTDGKVSEWTEDYGKGAHSNHRHR